METLNSLSTGCDLEPWFSALIRDPLSKDELTIKNEQLVSSWGKIYSVRNGILDLRLITKPFNEAQKQWADGQEAYEQFAERLIPEGRAEFFEREIVGVAPVYDEIPVEGACLDVGGLDGRVRTFMTDDQPYACVDPYLRAISDIALQPALIQAYPMLGNPKNFVCGSAESLPIAGEAFDTVHMRSVIDHFANPELALLEARRVLKRGGQVIIGISVEGGQTGRLSLREHARELARTALVTLGFERYRDHHIWHPTFPELRKLVTAAGFQIDKVHWQASEGGRVVYLSARKP